MSTTGLGTKLRLLIDTLDGDVAESYRRDGLNYRPRFTPVFRALAAESPLSIKRLAEQACVSHSALSQTITQMTLAGLVELSSGPDGRERLVALSAVGRGLSPKLTAHWAAADAAAADLEREIGFPLGSLLDEAQTALARRSFLARMGRRT